MMLPNGVLRFIQDFNSCITINEEQKQYRLYLSTELSFLRQRRVCYFRDFNNLNISIKSLPRNLLSKGFILCINFELLKTIIWFTLLQYTTDLFVAQSLIINICSVSFCNYKKNYANTLVCCFSIFGISKSDFVVNCEKSQALRDQ